MQVRYEAQLRMGNTVRRGHMSSNFRRAANPAAVAEAALRLNADLRTAREARARYRLPCALAAVHHSVDARVAS